MNATPTLGFLLHDVARLLRKRFEQRAKCLGLTRSQWQTLAYLSNNEGIHQGGLAEILEVEPITLVRILDKLAERGLIERRQHPTDRRIWMLYMRDEAHPAACRNARARRHHPRGSAARCSGRTARAAFPHPIRNEDEPGSGMPEPG
ncbi:DNA-binding MarR family transcriptional regulator [Rhizobium laguerreae]